MTRGSYVLVTPVRNEAATIAATIESVMQQTAPPQEWVIVSDESTDRTDEIVQQHIPRVGFLRLLRLTGRPKRNFGSVVFATEAGVAALKSTDYGFIGLLDGDVRFSANYYEEMLLRFRREPRLGIAGGAVVDCVDGQRGPAVRAMRDVAGAVQFFRRECFECLGGLVPLSEGGWDAVTCIQARMHGFTTRTFPELQVDHLKPRNISEGGYCRRTWQLGVREYALANHPLFEISKCAFRCLEYPYLLGGLLRFSGFAWAWLTRRQRVVPRDVVEFARKEQLSRLWRAFTQNSMGEG
jgi:biofilm PGA synthesis N-glycosyltransferase PgaC